MSEPTMEQLRGVLLGLSDAQLETIGVSIDRPDASWEWLRDIFVEALRTLDRTRAANCLANADLSRAPYSMGISRDFMRELDRILRLHIASQNGSQS